MPRVTNSILRILPSLCVAFLVGPIAILVVTFDLETIAAGFLIPLFLLPSLFLYTIFVEMDRFKKYAQLAYWIPAVAFLLHCILGWQLGGVAADLLYYVGLVFLAVSALTYPSLRFGENWIQKLKDRAI